MQSLIQFGLLFCLCLTAGASSSERRDLVRPGSQSIGDDQRIFDWPSFAGTSHLGEVKGRRASSFVRIGRKSTAEDEEREGVGPAQGILVLAGGARDFRSDRPSAWQRSSGPLSGRFDLKRRTGTVDSKKLSSFVRLGRRAPADDDDLLARDLFDAQDGDLLFVKP